MPEKVKSVFLVEWRDDEGNTGCSHYLCGEPPFDFHIYKQWLRQIAMLDEMFNIEEVVS